MIASETSKKTALKEKRDRVFDILSSSISCHDGVGGISCVGRERAAEALDEYLDAVILDRLERYHILAIRDPLD